MLKRRWLQRKKKRLMKIVAKDFNQSLQMRKEEKLKESLLSSTNDFDVVRLRDLHVFDDPLKMKLYRVMSAWKMYVQDRLRRETVLNRFLLFKKRMTSLRCFLSWRSVAKYEQSSMNSTNFRNSQHFSKGVVTSSIHSLAPGTR